MPWQNSGPAVYVSDESGAADWDGDWIPCGFASLLIFWIKWSAVALTNGTLVVEGTDDPSDPAKTIAFTLSSGVYGAWPTVGATADNAAAFIRNPAPYMRLRYVRTAGGAINQFNATRELRS